MKTELIDVAFESVAAELGVAISENDEIVIIRESDTVAMACCNKTDALCWTQM